MTDLLWPGDARAGELFSDASVLAALVRVEAAWLAALHEHGLAPATPGPDGLAGPVGVPGLAAAAGVPGLDGLAGPADLPGLAAAAEGGGNPVIPLVKLLRERHPEVAGSLHAGLTSQDVLDTALVLNLRACAGRLRDDLAAQIEALAELADRHRGTRMAGRTLTQHAIPITFGLKAAGWLHGVLDARDALEAAAALPIQIGGAAGSLAAATTLAGSPERALSLVRAAARALDLPVREPWHTARAPFTRIADAFVTCTDAWGRIANDVLVGSRPEVGELAEAPAPGRGGSSAMPNKHNPVLSVLVRRAALAGPPLAATLHTAAAEAVDERPDGSWHVEWATLRTLARRTVVAASQTAELLAGLHVDADRMAATLAAARPGIDAEQRKTLQSGLGRGARRRAGGVDGPYLGATEQLIDAALDRAGKPC